MGKKRRRRALVWAAIGIAAGCLCFFLLQRFWAHRDGSPGDPSARCAPLLGWFTREDRMREPGPALTDLRPGDILVTLSTHTAGWRHGHAGLVIDDETVLECAVLGQDSRLVSVEHWNTYSCYAVLRVRGASEEEGQAAADYAMEHLQGVPYRLTAGLWGAKAPALDSAGFGLHCVYLPWYVWVQFGYDLDGDGGRVVTVSDLLASPLLEVVQAYGMDPGSGMDKGPE